MTIKIEHKKKASTLNPGETISQPEWDDTHNQTMLGPALLGRSAATEGQVMELNATTAKTLLGLENVNNTSDANKPVSDAQQTAFDAKVNVADKATQAQIRAKTVNKYLAADMIDAVREGVSPFGMKPAPITGAYFGPNGINAPSTLALVANRIYFVPLFLAFDYNIEFLTMVTTSSGSGITNLGIYDTDPISGYPTGVGTLIGTISGSGTGAKKSSTVNTKMVHPGLVWAAVLPQTAHTVAGLTTGPAVAYTVSSTTTTAHLSFYGTSNYAAGVLPDFSTVTALTGAGLTYPMVFLGGP